MMTLFLPIPGLKTGVENNIFKSEIGSGFGEPGGTPPPKIPGKFLPPPPLQDTRPHLIKTWIALSTG